MDNKNDIERNRQLRRIADALEKIVKNMQKPIDNFTMAPNGITVQYGHAKEDDCKGTIEDTIHDR